MNNKGVAIKYGDVAPEAKENFAPNASESQFDTLNQLQQHNLNFPNYANPCELYSVVLDGTAQAFPSVPEQENLGLWSEQISNDDGTFTEPIVLILTSEGQYSSQGITFTFDTYNNIYPTRINIKWMRSTNEGEIIIDQKEFVPNDAFYFCHNLVEYYNKLEITFYSLNMPKNRLKLRIIDYGYGTYFRGSELRSVKIIQEINPISSEIAINTADFILDSKSDIQYSFQAKQPLGIYFNGELKAITFVKSSKRLAQRLWQIQSEDYISLLDGIQYYGGIYNNIKAIDILDDIFSIAKVPYKIDDIFKDATVTGYIPYGTCRNALMQVVFAIQAVVDTSNIDYVNIYALGDEEKQTIPLDRIMRGQNFNDEDVVTGLEIAIHSYNPITATTDVYDSNRSGKGENIFIKFSEPLHNLTITNGELIEFGANYAIINSQENCVLRGQKYEHITSIRRLDNPLILASDIEKVAVINNATLVSNNNIDNIIEKCYNWITKTQTISVAIVEGKHEAKSKGTKYGEASYGYFLYYSDLAKNGNIVYDKQTNVGEIISCETEYLGILKGRIIKQTFNLNGGIIIKNTEMR